MTVLTDEERRVIEAAYFSDLTYLEVSKRFDQPLGTVKTRVRSGLQKLRQALAGERVWSETGCTCVLITSTKDILR